MAQHLDFSQQDGYPPFNSNDLPSESPDLINMSGLGRPSGVGIRGFAQYAPLPTQGQVTGELMVGMPTFGTSHDQQTFAQGQGLSMIAYMQSRDGPWDPLGVGKGSLVGVPPSQDLRNFSTFRMPPPSEADTVSQSVGGVPSDSGYGSMARQSVGNPSIYGDMDPAFISRLQAMGKENVSSTAEPRKREVRGQRPTLGASSTKGIICPTCDTPLKTNSELKKHQARHSKPFKCNIPGCSKAIEGFSTNNDLDRHKKCVHRLLSGVETVYRCNLGQCRGKPKDWPRQDNFRQHLKRKHNLENLDLNRFMFRPSSSADLARFAPSEASLPEEAVSTVSVPLSHPPPWSALGYSHISSASFSGGDHRFSQGGGNMVSYHGQAPMGERDADPSEAAASQYRGQDGQESARLHLNMVPGPSGFDMSRSSTQGTNASIAEESSGLDQPTCVAPNVLSHARMETNSFGHMDNQPQPREVAQLEVDDSPGEFPEDAQSEVEEIEATVPDEMDVDDAAQDSASEDGHHNTDSEDDEPSDGITDIQSNLLRDAGAQYFKADEVHISTSPSPAQLGADAPQPIELDEETYASAVIQSLIKKGKLAEILKKVGYSVLEEAETKQQTPPVTSSVASESGRVNRCQECPKTFQRRCELKKHQKRHAKPYACTFAKCDKKFGSKNDWKRHENSQHFQLEIWRCAEKVVDRPEQPECGKVCHRRESLKSHLERDHHLGDHAVLDKKLADCRMGRNFESRFWCGFCQKTIEPTGKGGPAHSERFDHIDDHFIGRDMPKADIKDWKHVDTDPVDSPDSSPVRGGRGGVLGKGKAGRVAVGRSSNPLKRVHGEVGDGGAPRAKRFKDGNGKLFFWTCCNCGNYWRMGTMQCMDGCHHAYCDNCKVFDEDDSAQEPEPEVPAQGQVQMDGLTT